MSDPFRFYRTREHLEAATVNELIRRAKVPDQRGGNKIPALKHNSTVCFIRNIGGSGDEVEQFGILGIEGVAITEEDNSAEFKASIVLDGDVPEAASSSAEGHTGKFAIVQEPIAGGEMGLAVISGASPVQINVIDEEHQFADVKDGDNTQLESGHRGAARILYKASGIGTKWAVVRIGAHSVKLRIQEGWLQISHDGGGTWENEIEGFVCPPP